MRYDMDEILRKVYKDEKKVEPGHALNRETILKMQGESKMSIKTMNYKVKRVVKLAVVCCCICAVAGMSTVVYSEMVNYWNASMELKDGAERIQFAEDVAFKKIPENALKDMGEELSWDMAEKSLGFSLLGNGNVDDGTVSHKEYLNDDGSLAVVSLWVSNFKVFGDKLPDEDFYQQYITLDIEILNEGADAGYILPFQEGKDAAGEKELITQYFSEELNTEVIIYSSAISDISAVFVYDSVYYTLHGWGIDREQMIEAIDSMYLYK